MFRIMLMSLAVALTAGAASAQEKKKGDEIPAPRPTPMPMPMPPVVAGPAATPAPSPASPGTLWSPYQYQKYPVPGETVVVPGNAYGYLPSRAVYGPAASPNEYPYHAFAPFPPDSTSINPYPRHYSGYRSPVFPRYRGR